MAKKIRLSNNKKRKLRQLVDQATQIYMARQFDVCEQLCRQIEALQPGHADVLNMRGGICLNRQDGTGATDYFQKAVEAAPGRYEFRLNLGRVYLDALDIDRSSEAYAQYEHALELKPDEPLALLGACRALIALRRNREAEEMLDRVKIQKLADPGSCMGLAMAYRDLGRVDAALEVFGRLLSRYPEYAPGHFEKAQTLLQIGDREAAQLALKQVLSIDPEFSPALAELADISAINSPDDTLIADIEQAMAAENLAWDEAADLHVAMARCMQKIGDYDAAFEHFKSTNDLRAAHRAYDLDADLAHLDALTQHFSAEICGHTSGIEDDTPVFVVGMPRCGSTLTEQIMVSHPDADGRGESGLFHQVLAEHSHSDAPMRLEDMAGFSSAQWADIGGEYLRRLRESGLPAKRIVDKSLGNIRLIGAIHCALPHARIVHVRRHPLDNCLSIFTSYILGSAHDYGLKLGSLGYYYRTYRRLMLHWRDVLPAGVMHELDYERLVADQEGETRKLLDFIGLPWDARCLRFYETEQRVQTASIMQVRRAVNTQSVERWRRYEKHIQPLIKILGNENPWLAED